MSWLDTTYEKAMKAYFLEKLGDTKGEELFTEYTSVRNSMEDDNFFKEIKGKEPYLSDHSERHIQDVFERSYKLMEDIEFKKMSVYEVYCLALMILFHDVGNIYGRKDHDEIERIAKVYNKYRSNHSNYREERRIITIGASAHSGKTQNGSNDTLKNISTGTTLKGNNINLPELASILRLADELAEGRHRTCSFLIEQKLIEEASEIFHRYAEITNIAIDRNLERISITYHIDIPSKFNSKAKSDFKELMMFTYHRAVKLDLELRYTKYYSNILKKYHYITVQYNFSINEIPIEFDFGKITFEDRYPVPGNDFLTTKKDAEKMIIDINSNFSFNNIIEKINGIIRK